MLQKGFLFGQQGKKYGLIERNDTNQKQQQQTQSSEAQKNTKHLSNIFNQDSDTEEDLEDNQTNSSKKVNQFSRQADARTQKLIDDALKQDPNAFKYDEIYDSFKEEKVQEQQQKKKEQLERKPKYLQNIIKKAEERKQEQDVVYERKLVKEREVEGDVFGDKEQFITSAYRAKLEQNKQWMEAEKQRQLEEEKEDVIKKGNMDDFYMNMGKNEALGYDKSPKKQKTEKQEQLKIDSKDEKVNVKNKDRKVKETLEQLNEYDRKRLKADGKLPEHIQKEIDDQNKAHIKRTGNVMDFQDQIEQLKDQGSESEDDQRGNVTTQQQQQQGVAQNSSSVLSGNLQRRNDQSNVNAAKERYLARKRKAQK